MSSQKRLHILGAVILVAGFAAAAWVWLAQDRLDRDNAAQGGGFEDSSILDSRKSARQLQVMYGQSGLIFEEWSEWLKSLFHGKRLAAGIAVIASLIGLPCLAFADHVLAFAAVLKTPPEENQPSS